MNLESLTLLFEIATVAAGLVATYYWVRWLLALSAARNEQARYVGHRKFEQPMTALPDPACSSAEPKIMRCERAKA